MDKPCLDSQLQFSHLQMCTTRSLPRGVVKTELVGQCEGAYVCPANEGVATYLILIEINNPSHRRGPLGLSRGSPASKPCAVAERAGAGAAARSLNSWAQA